jgi:predicted O-methyltransferase YrrM
MPEVAELNVRLERPFDRDDRTSLSRDELICLVALARTAEAGRILEIGTFDGNTAINLAANTDADIVTIDLPKVFDPERGGVALPVRRLNLTDRAQLGRQLSASSSRDKIHQVYGDSATLDWQALGGPFDMVFIDGCHEAVYVESDSRNACSVLSHDGILVWHDYAMIPDVTRVVDAFLRDNRQFFGAAVEGTRLVVASRRWISRRNQHLEPRE